MSNINEADFIAEKTKDDIYDFIYEGCRQYTAIYNMVHIDKDFMCGHITADPLEEFIPKKMILSDGSLAMAIVPKIYENEISSNGNPKYPLCLVDSESFYKYFLPEDTIEGGLIPEHLKTRWARIQKILGHISDPKYKDTILYTLDSLTSTDELINKIVHRSYYNLNGEIAYDIVLDRHGLYFLKDEHKFNRVYNIIQDIWMEVDRNDRR